jgi:nickel transport protein
MRYSRSALRAAVFCLCLYLWGLPTAVFGHGVEVFDATDLLSDTGAVRTLRFTYSTGEPMMYAAVRLYPPSRPETEVLQGAADRNGYFSFTPDEPGWWRVTAEDGMGHKGELTVNAGGAAAAAVGGTANNEAAAISDAGGGGQGVVVGGPLLLRVILGVSLVLNIFAAYAWVLSRSHSRRHPTEGSHAHQ